MKLLTLVVVLMGFSSLAVTEVVNTFKHCSQFFFRGQTPTAPKWGQQKQICQRWKNQYMYATLYDTKFRIPVYSAYKFSSELTSESTKRENKWKNEPQLESITKQNKEMEYINNDSMKKYTHQAVDEDYKQKVKGIEYDRGHVFPKGYTANQDQADSTFAFTNIAPQTHPSNTQWETNVEEPMLKEIKRVCALSGRNPAYIVTGVVPGKEWIPIKREQTTFKEGVNIPSYFWTAYCCLNSRGVKVSNAYLGEQNKLNNKNPTAMSVKDLNSSLEDLYKTKPFSVFGDAC